MTITSASGSGAFALVYFGSLADTVDVKLRSTSDQTGFTQTLTETGLNTGVFTGTFTLDSSTTEDQVLQAANGDVITVSYTGCERRPDAHCHPQRGVGRSRSLQPWACRRYAHQCTTVTLTGDLVDAQSGVKASTIRFYLSVGGGFDEIPNEDDSDSGNFSNDEYTLNAITGGVQASVEVTLEPPTGVDTVYRWYLSGEDNAGNTGESDADTDADSPGTGECRPA